MRAMIGRGWGIVVAMVLAAAVAACSALSTSRPIDPVRSALAGIVSHDLEAAARHVCGEPRAYGGLPFAFGGLTGVVDGLSFEEGFALITFDASGLTLAEERREGDVAWVAITGVLVEYVDPFRFEAAYRRAHAADNEPIDEAFLGDKLRYLEDGRHDLRVEESVRVIREDGAWLICELPSTP